MLLKALTRMRNREFNLCATKTFVVYRGKISLKEKRPLEKLNQMLSFRLIFLDKLPYEEYQRLYKIAWGLLFPSMNEEPLPYVVVESMLTGTIPIAARVGGVPEIVKGTPAEEYLFTLGSINEFVDKVETLLSQPRDSIVNAGMKLREHTLKLFNEEKSKTK